MQYKIISVRSNPEYAARAIDWFSSRWGIDRREYEKSINDCISSNDRLPRWYLAIGENDEIIGGCGLILNDFVDRTDLFPYLCALFVEKEARGHALGSKLLEYARTEAGRLGFDNLYLCTDHTSYYEKYGCRYIGTGRHTWGETSRILDLGCGTGLELDEIFRRFPDVYVTGIDLTQAMLDRLEQKYHGRNIRLICGDYFKVDLGVDAYDAAISFQTTHHFDPDAKIRLYEKICKALKPGGVYIECDYMVEDQSEEDKLFTECARLRREMGVPDGEYYHFDTPCTIDNQIAMLKKAGFSMAEMVWRVENTTIIVAKNGCRCIPGVL